MRTAEATELADILTSADLKALVEAYDTDPEALADFGAKTIMSQLPPAADAVNALTNYFFTRNKKGEFPMSEKNRERGIISVLVATDIDAGWVLAVHFYWGLSVGLTPEDIANIILLSSTYSGIPHWTVNIFKLTQLLGQLKQIIDDPARKGPLSPVAIARAIIGQYQYETIDDIKKTLGKFGKSITKELQTLEQPSGSNGNGKGAPTKGPSR